MDQLRKWLHAAAAARTTCQNVDEFDLLIEHQELRLKQLGQSEQKRLQHERRLSFGFPDQPDTGTVVGTLPPMPGKVRPRGRTPEEAEIDRQLRKEREAEDLDAFLCCYERATGLSLEVHEHAENPDFIVRPTNDAKVGIELTAVRESPESSFYRHILTGNPEWDPTDAVDQMMFLVRQKSTKVSRYQTNYNVLVLQNEESNFSAMCADVKNIPIEDFAAAGFNEIWLADYSGIRKGEHREIELFGLYPKYRQTLTRRSDHDQKPYR
jgi:hypothetical protein